MKIKRTNLLSLVIKKGKISVSNTLWIFDRVKKTVKESVFDQVQLKWKRFNHFQSFLMGSEKFRLFSFYILLPTSTEKCCRLKKKKEGVLFAIWD